MLVPPLCLGKVNVTCVAVAFAIKIPGVPEDARSFCKWYINILVAPLDILIDKLTLSTSQADTKNIYVFPMVSPFRVREVV